LVHREVDNYWDKAARRRPPAREVRLAHRPFRRFVAGGAHGAMIRMFQDKDPEKAGRAMRAMMETVKLDLAAVQRAYDGR